MFVVCLASLLLAAIGCNGGDSGPNDPVVSAKEMDKNRPPTSGVPAATGGTEAPKK